MAHLPVADLVGWPPSLAFPEFLNSEAELYPLFQFYQP